MVIITIFGVGYGEVQALDDQPGLRAFTMGLIISGYLATLLIFGGIVKLIAEGEINKVIGELRKARSIEGVSEHTIICGYGRIGQVLAKELASDGQPFVIIDRAGERLDMAEAEGYLCVRGNATDEETLLTAGIRRARVLATVLPEDTANVYITLTARNLHKNLRIIARGEQPSAEKKLIQAGADEVVLPSSIGAQRIAHSITRPSSMELLRNVSGIPLQQDMKLLGLSLEELEIDVLKHLAGSTLAELQALTRGAVMVLAVHHADGSVLEGTPPQLRILPDDKLVVIVQGQNLPRGVLEPPKIRKMVHRGRVTEEVAAPSKHEPDA